MAEMLLESGPAVFKTTGRIAGFLAQVGPVKSSFKNLSMPTSQGFGTICRGRANLQALTLNDFPARIFLLLFTFHRPMKNVNSSSVINKMPEKTVDYQKRFC